MPFRAYARIWNEWFRDENLQQPVVQDIDDTTNNGSNTGNQLTDAQNGGLPLKAGKMHDYFSSCLPQPQKGEEVSIDIIGKNIPVYWADKNGNPLHNEYSWNIGIDEYDMMSNYPTSGSTAPPYTGEFTGDIGSQQPQNKNQNTPITARTRADSGNSTPMYMVAASSMQDSGININELRQAIAIQHILEADARGGTRYTELLKNEFGVTSPDSRIQRTEYIGGTRIPININQVIQQSATDTTSPQGNTAAYSLTTSRNKIVTYSATEHGYILGLAVVRVEHSYQQGLRRMWSRTRRFDFYHPMLANLGEMEVLNKEIYCQGKEDDDGVFGYQEAWADYRYHPNMVTGEMRSTAPQPLDAWHYADHYTELPVLSSEWIQEGKENIDRTIAVQSEVSHQFIANFYYEQTWTRPLPIYSVPGLEKI